MKPCDKRTIDNLPIDPSRGGDDGKRAYRPSVDETKDRWMGLVATAAVCSKGMLSAAFILSAKAASLVPIATMPSCAHPLQPPSQSQPAARKDEAPFRSCPTSVEPKTYGEGGPTREEMDRSREPHFHIERDHAVRVPIQVRVGARPSELVKAQHDRRWLSTSDCDGMDKEAEVVAPSAGPWPIATRVDVIDDSRRGSRG
jgi:hypothetical protein